MKNRREHVTDVDLGRDIYDGSEEIFFDEFYYMKIFSKVFVWIQDKPEELFNAWLADSEM
jgi:hypothetical protein